MVVRAAVSFQLVIALVDELQSYDPRHNRAKIDHTLLKRHADWCFDDGKKEVHAVVHNLVSPGFSDSVDLWGSWGSTGRSLQ